MNAPRREPAPRYSRVSLHTPRALAPGDALMMRRAAIASVAVSSLLAVVKALTFFLTGSVAVLASLVDSAIDLMASAGNLVAVRHAVAPADDQHRFGHGKAEAVAGLAQGAVIVGSMAFLANEAIRHLLDPQPVTFGEVGIMVMVLSMAVTFALITYQRRVVLKTRSLAIAADHMHYAGDLITNFGVIAAVVLSTQFGWHIADPLIGLIIAGVLAFSAWQILSAATNQLMDREIPDADRRRIKEIVLSHSQVRGLHDLRTRIAGTLKFLQLHVEMEPTMTLADAHEASDAIEAELLKAFPGAEILIHLDPYGAEAPPPLALS